MRTGKNGDFSSLLAVKIIKCINVNICYKAAAYYQNIIIFYKSANIAFFGK